MGRSGGAMVLGKLPVPGTFLLSSILSLLSPSLWETARYRLKYCLKGPLNPKQPTNQPTVWIIIGQGPTALAVGAGCVDIFLSSVISLFLLPPSGRRPDIVGWWVSCFGLNGP